MPSNILVVEDEPAISELISVNLQHAGHCPIRAYNAEQAQNLISDVLPDLVLLDWMLRASPVSRSRATCATTNGPSTFRSSC